MPKMQIPKRPLKKERKARRELSYRSKLAFKHARIERQLEKAKMEGNRGMATRLKSELAKVNEALQRIKNDKKIF